MRVDAPAKINWMLRVIARRPDGFHDLETLFQTITLHDTLTFEKARRLEVSCSDPSIPTGDSNLVTRAARALGVDDVAIHIEKRIPAGGGLGGGSSDAATTLKVLAGNAFDPERLAEIALTLGSDVPFFLLGGTAYATGRGEVLTPLPAGPPLPLLLLIPDERVMTAAAFGAIGELSTPIGLDAARRIATDPLGFSDELTNDFERPVFERLPALGALKRRLFETGAVWAGMSGSGSTMVGLYRDGSARDRAAELFPDVRTERVLTATA